MKEPVVREDNRSHASGNCPSGSGSAGRPDVNQRTKVALLTVSFSGFWSSAPPLADKAERRNNEQGRLSRPRGCRQTTIAN